MCPIFGTDLEGGGEERGGGVIGKGTRSEVGSFLNERGRSLTQNRLTNLLPFASKEEEEEDPFPLMQPACILLLLLSPPISDEIRPPPSPFLLPLRTHSQLWKYGGGDRKKHLDAHEKDGILGRPPFLAQTPFLTAKSGIGKNGAQGSSFPYAQNASARGLLLPWRPRAPPPKQ